MLPGDSPANLRTQRRALESGLGAETEESGVRSGAPPSAVRAAQVEADPRPRDSGYGPELELTRRRDPDLGWLRGCGVDGS